MNTQSEMFTPFVYSVIDDALLKAMPAIPYVGPFPLCIFLRQTRY